MAKRPPSPLALIPLGENPVNHYQAREYATESSPSPIFVVLELTENARDNATDVRLVIDVDSMRYQEGVHWLVPKSISCVDNGTGLTHDEFLTRFCGAFADSDAHHEVTRAGRNGVGTKTYFSIAERVIVRTTTGRRIEGFNGDLSELVGAMPPGLATPKNGAEDQLWRVYEFKLHTRGALTSKWERAEAMEMGTEVTLADIREGTLIPYETLIEKLSFAREWLQNRAHRFTVELRGNLTDSFKARRPLELKAWNFPKCEWLIEARGRSDEPLRITDPTTQDQIVIPSAKGLDGVLSFDLRVVGRNTEGQMQNLEKPALLLEICGALPYPPNLESVQSARTLPLLSFVGLDHSSSIGAFCNCVSGWARIESLAFKKLLRNNKTSLASGPGASQVLVLREYLEQLLKPLHRAWYNATRASQDEVVGDAIREAQEEVNFALKGANRSLTSGGNIPRSGTQVTEKSSHTPPRRHRWECGNCSKRWLADAGFAPTMCAETGTGLGQQGGCGSRSIGLAKNQPRIGDCLIRIRQLGDRRLPAIFGYEKVDEELELPVVDVNIQCPRFVELRGLGSLSGQAQRRLKQYLVDVALGAIASFNANASKLDFMTELGELYFNRMLRCTGIRQYENQLSKMLGDAGGGDAALLSASIS